ncbi:MAG: ATP synthase F1 subunit delta [Bryobacterales bacterium]|nr:ATP synthase F1 subunit delta [Bryobacterales bacterium]
MPRSVTSRYASALADVVVASKSLAAENVTVELRAFEAAMKESVELRNALLSPAVAPARKRAVIARLAEMMPLCREVKNFLMVLIDHRRSGALSEVIASFEAEIDGRLGVVRADVRSAQALSADQVQALAAELARVTGKKVKLDPKVEPELIGGVQVRIGSTVYDGSVQGRLDALGRQLRAG